jgi:uncharacterized protein (TIRG00374 family)
MTPRTKTSIKYVLTAAFTIACLYYAFQGIELAKVIEAAKNANIFWLLVSFAILILSHMARAWRWRYLLEPIKPAIGARNLFSGVMVGYLMNNFIPRAGELARPYVIGKLESIPKSAALGTVVVERVLDTVTFLLLVVLLPIVYVGPLKETFPWLENTGTIISAATLVFMVFIILMMVRRDWTSRFVRLLQPVIPERMLHKVEHMTHSFLDGFLFLKRPRSFLKIAVLSAVVWILYILMMYAAFIAFDLQGTLGLRSALVVQAISSIGVALPTPGATGTYHVFTSQAMNKLFFVPMEVALSYAVVTHAVGFIGITVVGLYYFWADKIMLSEAVEKQQANGS